MGKVTPLPNKDMDMALVAIAVKAARFPSQEEASLGEMLRGQVRKD